MGILFNFGSVIVHLVPMGAPLALAPLLVIIESISQLIRAFTLAAVRLAANIMAGHLIFGLLSSMTMMNVGGFCVSITFQTFMMMLELGVAVIQGFVFSILLVLYVAECY